VGGEERCEGKPCIVVGVLNMSQMKAYKLQTTKFYIIEP
jgi:hypothetical protein